jgi:DNA-binding response OmpR family regulator
MSGVLHIPHAAIAVCERTPYWAPELQRQLGEEGVAVHACQRLNDIDRVLADWPRCGVVLDFDAAPAPTLAWLARRISREAPTPVWLFASTGTAELEWIARETGATFFHCESISGRELATQCRRVLHKMPAA